MSESPLLDSQRENWGSRTGFVLAAVGSAVGLGNLWGFTYKVYAHGGGAFLIPYIFAMVAIGIPLLILELSLGHMTQRAAPNAFRAINRKTEPIGWWGILLGFVIITYYPVILAYCGNFLVFCVQGIFDGGKLPWAAEGAAGVGKAADFFKYTFLNRWTPAELAAGTKPHALGGFVTPIVIALAVTWVAMYLCIFKGVRLVSKVVLWTVPLPWIMLLILMVRGLTLPGATQGLNFFLHPTWEKLASPDTWRWAFGQMFFSMSLAFGVMITYASFLHRKSDINNNATIIGLADVATSFMAGIAVFATLGAMAFATQQAGNPVPVEDVAIKDAGLAFVAFPYALAQLPYAAWFGAVFFIALLTLGIDSAFSITESVLASIVDKTGWRRGRTLIGMTVVGFAVGLVYCTRGGLAWLGQIDEFINNPWGGIVLLGLLEAVVVGWAYRIGRLREHANERSDWKLGVWWDWIIRYFAPIILSALFAWSIMEELTKAGGLIHNPETGELDPTKFVALLIAGAIPVLAVILSVIRSAGANAHAEHIGQQSVGRRRGMVATGLLVVAIGGVACTVARMLSAGGIPTESGSHTFLGLNVATISLTPAIVAVLTVVVILLGGRTVSRAEKADRRPSSLARLSAGVGVLTLGSAFGLILYCLVALNPIAAATKTSETAPAAPQELSAPGHVVLALMIAMLVIGLIWCFYRAIKAGKNGGRQVSEI
ncbi:hypothetical protein LCGC14_0285020 [marine sediment metagenome]|uniref:Sodium-dependent transporter n=1 Tax=marine sediment metagenome TaxID=412755 RepID=A0A0F9X0H1_9ZZZZ|nr:hypothetical protein [Phycisphaerae bacterium]HDZ45034.1 hypothetical protein [Phycisphaerae bacterium]